ncbi:unnamed protein product [Adineta steineri]|uniref:Uncharacterized protein n=1 Tax=Adineta steineri TaxID=433720 RepID=A0A815JCS6_9BILA|nr:unnamed protein product [Adineta steineri]CAF1533318.1 unnamed protein product [Adineta steineri]CAF1607368.1 unnamed protein product [Adineta steineri]CAF1654499.1 unnamed protein product [Adineta steineri]
MNNSGLIEIGKVKSNNFFNFIEELTSSIEVEILKAQGINNALSLLRAQDLYSFFKVDCKKIEDLRNRACLQLTNGAYMIRPAIKDNLDYCIAVLKSKLNEQLLYKSDNHNQDLNVTNKELTYFTNTFISNLTDNMNRSKYRFQYNPNIRRFASAVYKLGGRNVYQLLQLNLPGAFPSIPTLESYNNEFCTRIEEGEFRFNELINHTNKINCSYVYASEDCSGIITKICYDADTNSFIGFCPELNYGIPSIRQYQTDDFLELETWFDTVKKSTSVNIHTVQPITRESSPPFLLSSFGADNQFTSISVLCRWLYIYEQCYSKSLGVVGFSSDTDPRFMKAMRLATGYFSQLPNVNLLNRNDVFEIEIPNSWTWYYMRSKQLFFYCQDGIHLATKLRNRLLSKTASLEMGTYHVSVKDLQNIIDNYSNILDMLNENKNSYATHCYLTILRYVTLSYIDKTTNILTRLFYAWSTVFISRFWLTWLKYKLMINTKQKYGLNLIPTLKKIEHHFMTFPAFYSIEINAHMLTYILLLVLNKKLPIESLNIFLFSSQPCENMFRSVRSLTGPFSTMTNFTIQQFWRKPEKYPY